MFASIWYAKKLGRRFVHNARKAKSEKASPAPIIVNTDTLDTIPYHFNSVKGSTLESTEAKKSFMEPYCQWDRN